jgi:putative transposase
MNTAKAYPLSERMACEVLNINRQTVLECRKKSAFVGPPKPRACVKQAPQPRALTPHERQEVLKTLNSDQYADQPPAQVYFDQLSQGLYLCSISTMHRLLRAEDQSGERRNQRSPKKYEPPRLHACSPNTVWTWDITKLPLTQRGVYLSLYVVMDLYSRYVVAWMLSNKENSSLASQLIAEASVRYAIAPDQLTIHQDRGAPMTAHCYLNLLGELAITASHSRPRVSNDNPMSESQFKTLKQQPDYPRRFQSQDHAQRWCADYFDWYNNHHHHSALAGFTPVQVFTGTHVAVASERQAALDAMYDKHPERFTKGRPVVAMPPTDVFINPVVGEDLPLASSAVQFPQARSRK